jgi:hypothetical protein
MKVGQIAVLLAVLVLFGTCAYAATLPNDCNIGGRYEDNGNGTVTDCRTGLIWLKNANCAATLTWKAAMQWAAALGNGTCSLSDGSSAGDWRLPTKTEWMAMVEYAKRYWSNPSLSNGSGSGQWTSGNIFLNVLNDYYWTSTTDVADARYAWTCGLIVGDVDSTNKSNTNYVWPVRGGQSESVGSLRIE